MINSELVERPEKEQTYPKLMVDKLNHVVVLFTCCGKGMVVHSKCNTQPVGLIIRCANMNNYIFYKNKIVLENK